MATQLKALPNLTSLPYGNGWMEKYDADGNLVTITNYLFENNKYSSVEWRRFEEEQNRKISEDQYTVEIEARNGRILPGSLSTVFWVKKKPCKALVWLAQVFSCFVKFKALIQRKVEVLKKRT